MLIHIEGSHGSLLVDATSGHILRADRCDCEDCVDDGGYASYAWFDPNGFDDDARKHGATDILYTSFVCKKGIYTRAMATMVVTDARHGEYVCAEEIYLLPAPEPVR